MYSTDDLVEMISLVVEKVIDEKLTQGEINHLSNGAALTDPQLDRVEVADVNYDEDGGEVISIDVIRYRVSDDPDGEPVAYRQTISAEDLKDYEIA